jgi:NADPH:quinone reductase
VSSPDRMRAVQYPTSGPHAAALTSVEPDRPDPGAGEVLVQVHVSGVNPTDWKSRLYGGFDTGHELVVPHHDGAGEIVAVGERVDPARVGERVWLYLAQWRRPQGTAAQWIALPSEQAVRLPARVSLDLGAGLGIPALTAHRCLFADGPVAGRSVLVQGGAGGVGHAAIELARFAGARVAATVSSEEKAKLADLAGADLVVNYRSEDVVEAVRTWAPDGVDRVIEVAVGTNIDTDAEVIVDGGVISSFGAPDKPIDPPRGLMARNCELKFVLVYTMPDAAKRDAVADITAALEQGALSALPAYRFPLEETGAAHDAVRDGAVGKVLVDLL